MNGRIEKENNAKAKMQDKLKDLPPVFAAYYNWLDSRDKSYTTMRNYIGHVIEFMNFVTKGEMDNEFYKKVTDEHIDAYMVFIRKKTVDGEDVYVGDDIRAAKWSSLNTFFKFLTQKKWIKHNPMLLTERPRVKTEHTVTYMTPKEIESVFRRITNESRVKVKHRDLCLFAIGVGMALRVSEIVNINIEDINFDACTIRVIAKERKTRDIGFSNNLKQLLQAWLIDRNKYFTEEADGPLFITQKKTRMTEVTAREIVARYTSHLPKHITPHKMRSSAATIMYGEGVDILTIQSILGHENVTTTQRYTTSYEKQRQNAINALDNLII